MTLDLTGVDLPTEVVRTERLLLRPPRPEDEAAITLACQDPEILRWTVNLPDPYTRADAEDWVRRIAPTERAGGRGLPCVIQADDALVGSAGLSWRRDEPTSCPEVGYWIAAPSRRRGYAAEATRALSDWAFAHGAAEVRLLTLIGNEPSQAVARRAGFTESGVMPGRLRLLDGSRADAALFVRRRDE
jgi:RimJ/RimL family protein N-acetyltransferase